VTFGIGMNAVQQLRVAATDMYPPHRRAEGLGYVLTGSMLGVLGGPVLVSLADARAPGLGLDPMGLAWMLVPLILLPSLALVLLVRPDPKEIAAHLDRYYPGYKGPLVSHTRGLPLGNVRRYFQHYPKLAVYVTSFALFSNMTMMMAFNGVALAHHGHDLPAISMSVAVHIVGMFGFSIPLGRVADAVGRRNVMLGGLVGAVIGVVLLPTTGDYWIATVGTFLVGLGWACVNVAGVALIADTSDYQERGRALGVNDACGGLGSVTMPLLVGPLIGLAGLPSLAIVSALLMLPPLVLLLRLREPTPGQYDHPMPAE
jgi:MFS family permease